MTVTPTIADLEAEIETLKAALRAADELKIRLRWWAVRGWDWLASTPVERSIFEQQAAYSNRAIERYQKHRDPHPE